MLWIKAFHIIFMTTWMAGLFYLPRLFVYHADATDTLSDERFKIMERRLYFGITTPGMIITTILGLWLIALNPHYYLTAGWLHAKLACVLLLLIYHVYCGKYLLQFKRNQNTKSATFYRVFNEVTLVLFIPIVILVVVRPF